MAYRDLLQGKEIFDIQGFTERGGSSHLCRVQIGDDDETGDVYSILVSLGAAIAQPPQHMEIMFFVIRTVPATGYSEDLSDGRQTKSFLDSAALRDGVLELICAVCCELLKLVKPDVVNYMTADINLPEKALKKYEVLCKALKTVGYEGREVDVYHGNHMWVLQRVVA